MPTEADRYLFRHHRTYVLKMAVPRDLREAEGRSMIVLSLRTGDLREARGRRDIELGRIRERWARLRSEVSNEPGTLDWLTARLADLRTARQRNQVDVEQASLESLELLDVFLQRQPQDPEGGPIVDDEDTETIRSSIASVSDPQQITLAEAAASYLSEMKPRVTPQTYAETSRRLDLMLEHFGKTRSPSSITRRDASGFLTDVVLPRPWSVKTQRETLSTLSTFYAWAEVRGLTDTNPFHRLSGSLKTSRRPSSKTVRPWTSDELATMLTSDAFKADLKSMGAIALFTGLRREEIALLRVDDVSDDLITVAGTKSKAAARQVPVHPTLAPLLARLIDSTTDDYLLPGLKPGGPNKLRAHSIGKRFDTARRSTKLTAVRFHDLRRTFAQGLETAGIPESTAKQIIGHERDSMTYGLYSPGVRLPELKQAVEAVTFGKDVEQLVWDLRAA